MEHGMRGHWEKGRYIVGNKQAASWSKWGGVRYGNTESQEKKLPRWVCQICKREQLTGFPEYPLLFDEETREYLRICTECRFRSVISRSYTFEALRIEYETKDIRDYLSTLATLLTAPIF